AFPVLHFAGHGGAFPAASTLAPADDARARRCGNKAKVALATQFLFGFGSPIAGCFQTLVGLEVPALVKQAVGAGFGLVLLDVIQIAAFYAEAAAHFVKQ